MQPLNPKDIFSIFDAGDEAIYKEHGLESTMDNPYVLMGMVLRGIESYHLMDEMYTRQHPKEYKAVRDRVKYKYLTNLYTYLCRLDYSNFDEVYKISESFDKYRAGYALDFLRKYYEALEEYEKCAVIKKYYDLLTDRETVK